MPSISERLAILRRTPRAWRVGALSEALRVCSAEEAALIAADLLELAVAPPPVARSLARWLRKGDEALSDAASLSLLRSWSKLAPESKRDAISCLDRQAIEFVKRLAASESPVDRSAAMAVACDCPGPGALDLAGKLLFDGDESVSGAAEEALLLAAKGLASLSPESKAALDVALATAGVRYPDHRRRGIMAGVLRACESPGPHLLRWLRDEGHPGHLALRAALRQSTDPATRARCVRWLTLGALAPAALERLQREGSETEFEQALPLGYLLLNPARSAKVARAVKGMELLPDAAPGASARLSVAARRELPRWICAAPVTPANRLARLAALLVDGDSAVRLASVRRVATLTRSSPEGVDALVDFSYDAAEQVATAACVQLAAGPAHVRACAASLRAWARLRRSPHASVRRVAQRESSLIDPLASLCSGVSDPGVAGAALRLRARTDRAGVVSALRRAIREGEPAGRVRGVLAARRAELTGDCELELLACAADAGEPTVAATAVAALVDVRSSAARSLLERCLGHPDARVRANAIEAVGRQRPDHASIIEAVRDASARARANAVRLVLLADESAPGDALLAAMLSDDRIEHRVAGLWAAERLGRTSLAERVALMARSATSEHERAWAHRCGKRLLGGMRVAWANTPFRDEQSEQGT